MSTTKTFKLDLVGSGKLQDYSFIFAKLSAPKQLKLIMFIGRKIGMSAGDIMKSLAGGKIDIKKLSNIKDDDISLSQVGSIIASILGSLEDDEVIEKINILLDSVSINGEKTDMEHLIFDGNLPFLIKIIWIAFKENFSNFLPENLEIKEKLQKTLDVMKNHLKA